MKKIIFTIVTLLVAVPLASASAQMMYGNYYDNGSENTNTNKNTAYPYGMMGYPGYDDSSVSATNTAVKNATSSQAMDADQSAGQVIAQKLKANSLTCTDLTQTNYENLGDYYMGLMMGSSHEAMDNSIEQRYGADYLKSMHIAMGERFSGCNSNVVFPAGMKGFGPMMGDGYNNQGGQYNGYGMMSGWDNGYSGDGYGLGGMLFMGIFGILAIIGLVTLVKWTIRITSKNK